MKYVIIFFLIATFGCSEENPEPNVNGCITGIPKNSTTREFMRCGTKQEFNQGGKVYVSGAPWESYTNHKWEQCSDCK